MTALLAQFFLGNKGPWPRTDGTAGARLQDDSELLQETRGRGHRHSRLRAQGDSQLHSNPLRVPLKSHLRISPPKRFPSYNEIVVTVWAGSHACG